MMSGITERSLLTATPVVAVITGCKKDKPDAVPSVTTSEAINITISGAPAGGAAIITGYVSLYLTTSGLCPDNKDYDSVRAIEKEFEYHQASSVRGGGVLVIGLHQLPAVLGGPQNKPQVLKPDRSGRAKKIIIIK